MQRALTHALLVLCLLVAQHAGFAHALSHLEHGSPAGQDKPLPHSKMCDQCGLSAQLGTGLLGSAAVLVTAAASPRVAAPTSRVVYPAAPRRFLSRAPPTYL